MVILWSYFSNSVLECTRAFILATAGCDNHHLSHFLRFFYNSYFSACFFYRNSVFLSQQINRNSISACFFSNANGTIVGQTNFNVSHPSIKIDHGTTRAHVTIPTPSSSHQANRVLMHRPRT